MPDSNVIDFDRERREEQIRVQKRMENLRNLRRSIDKELARFSSEEGDRRPHVSKVTSPEGIPFRVVADVA